MNDDGSDARRLVKVDRATGNRGPAWSPDGRKIAFSSSRPLDGNDTAVGNWNIWVVNSDGSGEVPLTRLGRSTRYIRSESIAWSPDGRKLAFVSFRALDGSDAQNQNEAPNVWVVSADGSSLKPLTKFTENSAISVPVWSSDSAKVAFLWFHSSDIFDSPEPGVPRHIWIINSDGSALRPLTKLTEKFVSAPWYWPWSPDGSKLTVTVKGGNIWEMNSDGSGARPLMDVHEKWATSTPVWSPDGTQIAFLHADYVESPLKDRRVRHNLWVINADGSGATQLTHFLGPQLITGGFSWRP
jgi:Tol biopolymer transport system component